MSREKEMEEICLHRLPDGATVDWMEHSYLFCKPQVTPKVLMHSKKSFVVCFLLGVGISNFT